jgi:hypothetical protein
MKKVERSELLGLGDYEAIREPFRARVIAEKKLRRLAVGPRMSVLFENHDTVLLQIQEMLRTERITKEAAVLHEMATYNALVPGDHELSTTIFLEVDEPKARTEFLAAMKGFHEQVFVVVGERRFGAQVDAERIYDDRASAVNYFKFPLDEAATRALAAAARGEEGAPAVRFVVTHPAYPHDVALPRPTLASLAEDYAT